MAQNFKRPKPDHLLNEALHGDAIADSIHHSIMPVDEIAARLELKWGCDRLPGLVSPDTASRFGSAKAKLDTGIQDNDAARAVLSSPSPQPPQRQLKALGPIRP